VRKGLLIFVLQVCVGFGLLSQLYAQTNLADIGGTLTDSSGATIANATVTLQNKATTATRMTTTSSTGIYTFPSLQPGTYTIKATATGFQTAATTVDLTLSGVTANLTLAIGKASETVVVSEASGSVALQTESGELNQSFGETQLTLLPNSNALSVLSIATVGPASQAGTDEQESGDAGFYNQTSNSVNIAGLGIAHAQFLQDGVENVNLLTATANVVSNVEAAQGVTTTLNGSPARFGQPSVVNVITKSGSNIFHGSAYEFLQNDDLNATNWYATQKPPLRYNNFGAGLGGPILKKKIFGYLNYTGLRNHSFYVSENRVPTSAELLGNFQNDNVASAIYDPATYSASTGTTQPFPNNQIPSARIDNFARQWLKNYPAANVPLSANNVNYIANVSSNTNSDEYIARGDWNISSNNQLVATFLRASVSSGSDTIVPGLFGIFFDTTGINTALQDSYSLSPRMVNIFKAGFNRGQLLRTQQGTGAANYAQQYGLSYLDASPAQWLPPRVSMSNYTGFGDPYSPQGGLQNRYQLADELDWTLGRHSLAMGGQFVKTQFFGNWTVGNNGQFNFDGSATSQYINGQRSSTNFGNALADLLLGYPQSGSDATGITVGWFREWQVAGYVQDDWKLTQRLTLNLGLRYDFDNPPIDSQEGAIYNLALNKAFPGTWKTNYNDYGPRFGFSWGIMKNTVIRGGYGIYFSPIMYNNLQFELLYAPNFNTETVNIDIASPAKIENLLPPIPPQNAGFGISKTLKDTSADEWNLNIERSLNDKTLLTLAYIGDVTRHMSARADNNEAYALSPGNTSGVLDLRPQPLVGPQQTQLNVYNSNYNALAASLQRRYASGLQFLLSYTWSKAMDIVDGDNTDIENYYHPNLTYSPATFDRTNNVQLSGVYDLPIGPGRHFINGGGLVNREVLGGWQLSFLQQLASGQPNSIYSNDNADTSGSVDNAYGLEICNPKSGFTKTRFLLFNPACFIQEPVGVYGRTRNVSAARDPGLFPTDLSLIKSFAIYREQQLQFRVDAFSALNHPELGIQYLAGNAGSPSLGVPNYEESGLRSLQVALKYQF
jgi:hypothetical protein